MTERNNSDVTIDLHGIITRFYLPHRQSDHIQRHIADSGSFYEQDMLEHCRALLQPGDIVIDAGAYIGNHTLFFANVCGAAVHAFEPNPEAFDVLTANIEINNQVDAIQAHSMGLGAAQQTASLDLAGASGNLGTCRLKLSDGPVTVVALDELELPGPVRLMKIDVEGMEEAVLEGAAGVIRRDLPFLFVECATYASFATVQARLAGWGYAAAGQFNATPTLFFDPHGPTPQVLNQQRAQAHYATAAELRGIGVKMRRVSAHLRELDSTVGVLGKSTRKLEHEVIVWQEANRSTSRQTLSLLSSDMSKIAEVLEELRRSTQNLSSRVHEMSRHQGSLADRLDGLVRARELQARPLAVRGIQKAQKLRRNPERFVLDSRYLNSILQQRHRENQAEAATPAVYARKLVKLISKPERFLTDAKNPILNRWGLNAYRRLAKDSSSSLGDAEWVLPKASVIVLVIGDVRAQLAAVKQYERALSAEHELLLLAGPKEARELCTFMSSLPTLRTRVYLFAASASLSAILRYGLARALGSAVVVVGDATKTNARAIRSAIDIPLGGLREFRLAPAASGWRVSRHLVVLSQDAVTKYIATELPQQLLNAVASMAPEPCSTRSASLRIIRYIPRLRPRLIEDLAIGGLNQIETLVIGPNVSRLVQALDDVGIVKQSNATFIDSENFSGYFVYAGPPVGAPIARREGPLVSVLCFERKPDWFAHVGRQLAAQTQTVSVVMTVFNTESTLAQAIDSVMEQSYSNIELILVDDCSTDNSLEVARRKANHDPRIKILQTPRNSGTYVAKNLGISAATGELVALHDSDDVSLGHRLELQVGHLIRETNELISICLYQRATMDGQPQVVAGKLNRRAPAAVLFRRRPVLDRIGYFDSTRIGADDEFIARLETSIGKKCLRLPHVLYIAYSTAGALTAAGVGRITVDDMGKVQIPAARREYYAAARQWHQEASADGASLRLEFPLLRRKFPAPVDILPTRTVQQDQYVTASMATIPSRVQLLEQVVSTLLPQVDRLNVYLNGFNEIPHFLKDARIEVARSQEYGDQKDNGKFFWSERVATGYHLTVDDDIIYPRDFVQRSIMKIEQYDRRAVVGVHGVNLANPLQRYTESREVFHFGDALLQDAFVHLLGTGTIAYHTSTLQIAFDEFKTRGVADLWFAIQARRQRVPLIAQSRPRNWLAPIRHEGETIFAHARRDDSGETHVAQAHGPWSASAFEPIHRIAAEVVAPRGRLESARVRGGDVHQIAALLGAPQIQFSIIVPGWNCEEHVPDCWRSLVEQVPGHYSWEALMLDDGSDDDTWKSLCALPADSRRRIYRNESNYGPAYSRWELLQRVKDPQRVCVLLDLDDVLLPHALRVIADEYLVSPQCLLTSGNWMSSAGRKNPLEFYNERTVELSAYREAPFFKCAPPRSFRRFLANGVDPQGLKGPDGDWLKHCTDVALMLPLLEQCGPENIRIIHKPIYKYTEQRPSGTIKRFGKASKVEAYRWLCSMRRVARLSNARAGGSSAVE